MFRNQNWPNTAPSGVTLATAARHEVPVAHGPLCRTSTGSRHTTVESAIRRSATRFAPFLIQPQRSLLYGALARGWLIRVLHTGWPMPSHAAPCFDHASRRVPGRCPLRVSSAGPITIHWQIEQMTDPTTQGKLRGLTY